jgi:hypothetical protein
MAAFQIRVQTSLPFDSKPRQLLERLRHGFLHEVFGITERPRPIGKRLCAQR